MSRVRPKFLPALAWLVAVACGAAVAAASRGDTVPVAREAIAIRGEPVVIEVRVSGPPAAAQAALIAGESRRALPSRLIWPYLPLPSGASLARWACATSPLRFSDLRAEGSSLASLAVEIPADAPDDAVLEIAGARVRLAVFDAGPADLFDRIARRASMLVPEGAPDPMLTLPEPGAPLERFRFAIGVPMRGWPQPEPFAGQSADALAERAHTALWRAALWRTMRASPGTATELAELLVASCRDDTAPAPIAAWIASADELRAILRLAFSRDFEGERLAASVNEFLRVRSSVLWWIEDSDAGSITIAIANPTTREQVARTQWLAGTEEDMLPAAVAVPPISVRRQRLARPTIERNPLAPDQPVALEQLRLACGSSTEVVVAPRARLAIDAGGLEIVDTFAPLHVVSVSPGRRGAVASGSTRISVRERLAGWELFAEARASLPGSAAEGSFCAAGPGGGLVRVDASAATATESVDLPPDAIAFARYADRFRTSFVLPADWVRRDGGETIAEVGFRRELEGGFADAPFACVPWRARPRTILLDLASRP